MAHYVTEDRINDIAALRGASPDERRTALDVADRIYAFMRRSEGQREFSVPDEAIRRWAERQDIAADDVTRALAVLEDSGRVLSFAGEDNGFAVRDADRVEVPLPGTLPAPDEPLPASPDPVPEESA